MLTEHKGWYCIYHFIIIIIISLYNTYTNQTPASTIDMTAIMKRRDYSFKWFQTNSGIWSLPLLFMCLACIKSDKSSINFDIETNVKLTRIKSKQNAASMMNIRHPLSRFPIESKTCGTMFIVQTRATSKSNLLRTARSASLAL